MCLIIPPNNYKLSIPDLMLNDSKLQYVDRVQYLGVFLTTDFKDNTDIQRQHRSLYASANTVMSKFKNCTQSVKCLLIESFCLNIYCSYLWWKYSNNNIAKLRVAYTNIYRKLLGYSRRDSASVMFASNRIDSFAAKMCKVVYSFRKRADNSVIMSYFSQVTVILSLIYSFILWYWFPTLI